MLNNFMSTSIEHSQMYGLKDLYEILSLFPGSVMKSNFGISPSGLAPTFFGGQVVLIPDFSNVKNTKLLAVVENLNYKFVTPLPADRYVSAFFLILLINYRSYEKRTFQWSGRFSQ